MFETVLNPLAWWGLLAVAVPVIIHLINRLRYKRIEWAAMEFLLKAMQRHKRKLLMEQLLLLLLRCLLILLVVLLIVRPLWFLGGSDGGSLHHHVILLDDSFSMNDIDTPMQPEGTTAFRRGAQLLSSLAQAQSEGNAAHHWTILSWSNPTVPEIGMPLTSEKPEGARLNSETVTRIRERLDEMKPSGLAVAPLAAIQEAARHLETVKDGRKHLHIVSDFRLNTWRDAGDEAYTLLADMAKQGKVRVQFHDVAGPARSTASGEAPPAHGNLGITQLVVRPRRSAEAQISQADLPLRVVTPRLPFDVHVTVKNFGAAEHSKVRLSLSSDGVERAERMIERLSGGEERNLIFNLEYTVDEPVGIKPLLARLDDPQGRDHLGVDDVRYGYVELRSKVQALIVDPEARGSQNDADWLYVTAALTGASRTGIQTDIITPRELGQRKNLANYSVIYLLNPAGVGRSEGDLDEEGLKTLEGFVRNGGSLAFFLGPRTNVASFNERLYQKGQGIFPAPLLVRPDPEGRSNSTFIDEEPDKDDYFAKVRFLKLHAAFPFTGELADTFARFIHVNRYFRVDPQWKPGDGTEVLVQLMNRRPLVLYRDQARGLAAELSTVAGEVPEGKLTQHVGKIIASVDDADKKKARKGELISALSGALGEPAAVNFWKDRQHAELQKKLRDFMDILQQGDPLVIESRVAGGARPGRVIAFMTPAAPTPVKGKDYGWHDLATGDLAQFFFVPMIIGVQEHLAAQARASELTNSALVQVQPIELRLDKDRYHSQVELWYQDDTTRQPAKVDTVQGEKVKPLFEPVRQPGDTSRPAEQYDWLVKIKPIKGAGHYRLKFNQVTGAVGASDTSVKVDGGIRLDTSKIPEERPLAFNLDVRQESELLRIGSEQIKEALADGLVKGPAKTPLAEATEFVQGKSWFISNALDAQANEALQSQSWSEYSWVLLLFVGLLILEQYLAMKFSHHVA